MSSDVEPLMMELTGYAETRRLRRGKQVVGLIQECSNGRWILCDENDHPMSDGTFRNPTAAWREADRLGVGLST